MQPPTDTPTRPTDAELDAASPMMLLTYVGDTIVGTTLLLSPAFLAQPEELRAEQIDVLHDAIADQSQHHPDGWSPTLYLRPSHDRPGHPDLDIFDLGM